MHTASALECHEADVSAELVRNHPIDQCIEHLLEHIKSAESCALSPLVGPPVIDTELVAALGSELPVATIILLLEHIAISKCTCCSPMHDVNLF